ncbi:MAG: malto-oligosyltrehalose synthase [Deltaproteobacteria bacterium]|nr:malto-oligosyltrehalose synthase [Deltaproteobacteria bacterium]
MKIPSSTYRLQFNFLFGFKDAKETIGYLNELGITDIYASPVLKARKGSMHGYDTVDHGVLNPELGTDDDFKSLLYEVKKHRMGWVQDIVSNHMAYDGANHMLMDVLEKGRESRYIGFFDIEWDHPYEGIKGRVLAPFLGKIYGEALESGEIKLSYDEDSGISVNYFGFSFPLKIESYATILTHELKRLKKKLGKEDPDFIKLIGIIYVLKNLPAASEFSELQDQVIFVKRMLKDLYAGNREIKAFMDENISILNGRAGDPESFNMMDRLLSEQSFKFSFWKVAAEEINYRRFFNINELITLKIEDEAVFNHVHSLILKLVEAGVTGLRIDHIDGFYDPFKYLKRIREKTGDIYLVVEKILAQDELLPSFWPVEGTTGYDFLNKLNGIYCDTAREARFTRTYIIFAGLKDSYTDIYYEKKKLITEMDMTSDVANLAQLLKITLSKDRYGSDITLSGLKKALIEVMANFPVYRTYINHVSFTGADRASVKEAVGKAVSRTPALLNELGFIEKVLCLEYRDYLTDEEKKEWLHFVMKFQQFTGPLMAKGFEDTFLYVYGRLLSLNEVGGDPGRFGISRDALHNFNKNRASATPHSMNATSTHDTKRGEDLRARLNVLSEFPQEWEEGLRRWSVINKKDKRFVGGRYVPDRNDEYFLYQTLIGAIPFAEDIGGTFIERIKQYMVKAVREAKIHTAWLKPDAEYEDSFLAFIESILKGSPQNGFLQDFLPFQRKIAWYGIFNSLSQLVIKLTSPGLPDFYQGTELWDLNLVDPDNRRPVDFIKRKKILREIKEKENRGLKSLAAGLLKEAEDGKVKLFTIYMALKARRDRAELFDYGSYIPLETKGAFQKNIFSFARERNGARMVTAAPRFLSMLAKEDVLPVGDVWGDTEILLPNSLSGAPWRDAFTGNEITGRSLKAGEVFSDFPVALLLNGNG